MEELHCEIQEKTAQKKDNVFPWLWEANIKTRRFNEWYISFLCRVEKKEVGIFESHIHNVIQV